MSNISIADYLKQIRLEAWNSRQLGTEFERFVKRYLKAEPSYAALFSDVWLWGECPFAKGSDVGIDLVAKTNFGEYVAIQAKCYQPGTQVDKADVDTFLSASGKQIYPDGKATFYSQRIIIATNDNWTNHASEAIVGQQIPVTRIGLDQIRDSAIDWDKFFSSGKGVVVKKSLRPHQEIAVKDVLAGFKKHERGQLIMACGTGKTYTSLKIAEELCGQNGKVLFLVPSISLLGQSLREWCEQAENPLTAFAVCSDAKVTQKDPDDTSLADLGFPATTSAAQLAAYSRRLKKNPPKGLTVVFSTYQSISAVHEAQAAGALGTFDLIICDEAHRTTGAIFKNKDESEFVRVHDPKFIKGAKRLYMTATPRIYGDNAKKKADDEFIELCSMDDETKYGPEFHHLTFSQAVAQELLTDYKVLILAVDEKDMRELSLADRDGDGEIDSVDQLAKIVGTWKGLNKRIYKDDDPFLGGDHKPMRSAVAFSATIADSKAFTGQFNQVVEEHFGEDENLQPVEIHHVDGTMNALYRAAKLRWLKEANGETGCRILSNAKCLSEGVDVPGLDAVIFLSPKNSFVEVVQAIGRVMRRAPGKETGYVIIPVLIPMGMDASEALSTNKRFKVVWDVLSAIRSHDDAFNALDNKVDIIRVEPPKKKKKGGESGGGDGSGDGDGEYDDLPPITIDTERFNDYKKAIQAKLVKACGEHKYWSVWASEIAEIVQTQIKRITALLQAKDSPYEDDFSNFHETLRANLNKTVTRDEAIAMLAQQLVSAPVFDALFADYQFIRNNPISKALGVLLEKLNKNIDAKDRDTLEKFYESVRRKASTNTTAAQKQQIVLQLYDNFFNIAFKETVEKLGIVYTPVPVVDFIVKSVEVALQKHFGHSLSEKGVHILDPFTGTGTFITRLLQSGIIKPKDLLYKYENEIHANEIVLLAYYIAAINIESVFHDVLGDGKFHPFDGIVLADTFQMTEEMNTLPGIFPENSQRAAKQKKLDIRVIFGNPPYSIGQKSANDDNANLHYPALESRIDATYAKGGSATLKKGLYDSYIKAFRWASDRIKDEGIVAFVTNGGWLDAQAMNGFRNSLIAEFSHIYVFNLRGNQRTQGELSRREGGKIFGSGSRTPVAITILVKTKKKSACQIHYHDIGDYLSRDEKLRIIDDFGDITRIEWQPITPDKHGDWLNKRDSEFDDYVPLAPDKKFDIQAKAFFTTYSLGCSTNRDAWVYNASKQTLIGNLNRMITFFNEEIDRTDGDARIVNRDSKKLAWTVNAIKALSQKRKSTLQSNNICVSSYRPFEKEWLYYSREWNERPAQWDVLLPGGKQNKFICVSGEDVIITDSIPNLHYCGDVQAFPLYWYEERKRSDNLAYFPGMEPESGYIRHDAISDFILQEFRRIASPKVQKEDIFHWVYGALHNPDYRAKFAADLKKQLPRLPLPKDKKDYEKVLEIGRKLALLHLHYEEIDPWPLDEIGKIDYHVTKMAWAKDGKAVRKDMLVVNPSLTLAGIPKEAHEYVVNGRTPIEWLIERYQVKTDAESGIVNDPNKWGEEHGYPEYIVELVKRIVRLSVETVELVKQLGDPKAAKAVQDDETAERVPAGITPPYWWKSQKPGVPSPMPDGGNVVIGLAHKWYDKIEAGLKHDEFRQKKPYWDERLGGRKGKELRSVTFMKGKASSEQMTWEVTSVETATQPGYAGYYVIHLGKRIR